VTNRTETLINRLNQLIGVEGGESFVSPTSRPSGGTSVPKDGIYIHADMNYDGLTKEQLTMVHVLLHLFYASGHKDLNRKTIERLHAYIVEKINHKDFDRLDRK